jgi:Mn2+/Fe2+ NRAMP family transporter
LMAGDRKVMGKFVISSWLKLLGWATAIIMAVAVVAMFWMMR